MNMKEFIYTDKNCYFCTSVYYKLRRDASDQLHYGFERVIHEYLDGNKSKKDLSDQLIKLLKDDEIFAEQDEHQKKECIKNNHQTGTHSNWPS